jgi:hypothetical protein
MKYETIEQKTECDEKSREHVEVPANLEEWKIKVLTYLMPSREIYVGGK